MKYPKINSIYKRWQKDLHPEDMLPEGVKYGDFKEGEFACDEFEYLFYNEWIWSEKLDGMNIRIYINDNNMTIAGRTDNAQIPQNLHKWISEWYNLHKDELHKQFPKGAILYGEGVGKKIQKGSLFGEQHFKLFDVMIGDFWLTKDAVRGIAKQFNLDTPMCWVGTVPAAIKSVKSKPKSQYGDFIIEGYVGIPKYRLYSAKKERIITKIKVKDFR